MFAGGLYVLCIIIIIWSSFNDRQKTKAAFIRAWKSFENILPQLLGVLLFVGIILAYFDADLIAKILGDQSGWRGVLIAALVGAVTLIPGFVAFPTAALLVNNGAGLMQIGAFVSTLMMVGVVTVPVEAKYFGKRVTLYRNLFAFIFSFIVAWIIGVIVG